MAILKTTVQIDYRTAGLWQLKGFGVWPEPERGGFGGCDALLFDDGASVSGPLEINVSVPDRIRDNIHIRYHWCSEVNRRWNPEDPYNPLR